MCRLPQRAGKRSANQIELVEDDDAYGEIIEFSAKPKIRVGAPVSSKPCRLLLIGDAHDHPGLPNKRRAELIGHHAVAFGADWAVSVGDLSDANSACHHVRNDTYRARKKPSFAQDLDSFEQFMEAMTDPISRSGMRIRLHETLGNHENWWWTFEDQHPELQGLVTGRLEGILRGHGWTWTPFGEWFFVGGVGITHVPLNIMGKPFGGQNVEKTVAQWATFDVIFGHTHRHAEIMVPKLGVRNYVKVLNVGSAMPEGYVGDYARNTPNAYSYGVVECVVFDGHIQSSRFVTMRELEAMHASKLDHRMARAA